MKTSPALLAFVLTAASALAAEPRLIQTDFLIVGGTESGCAAAVAAARAGVKSIVLANDIEWLGGQFSAESLAAIDENRGPEGYGHGVPFPRNGLFREVIDRIESLNREKYGHPRPGNTRVITTSRPVDSEQVFRELLQPYVESGQVRMISWAVPVEVLREDSGKRVTGVRFEQGEENESVTVHARLTMDASDWGDVIRMSGAAYEFGPDLRSTYGEPLAPESREDYPLTDMNPITYCMMLEETDGDALIPAPPGYDPENYRHHTYPKDPLWLYASRRVVDHYNLPEVIHPDVLLLCFPAFDYPVDVYPAALAAQLEADQPGASRKNIVEMTRHQRQLVFQNAREYSQGFLRYLQTEVHDTMPDKTHSFRRFRLSHEFGTADHMPPKPYVRESLRLKAMYMLRQQDTMGHSGRATNFASVMQHDGIACWQFEYDFHPTRRKFLTDKAPAGPWLADFRKGRTWGPPYSGRSLFPVRSLVPEEIDSLIGGQKNLGYTSIVSSAVRLHDQSMAIGQGAGAVAATCLKHNVQPREVPWNQSLLSEVWSQLTSTEQGAVPQTLWPFADLDPLHPDFVAVQQLAIRGAFPLQASQIEFQADRPADADWIGQVVARSRERKQFSADIQPPPGDLSRSEFATAWWALIKDAPEKEFESVKAGDRDGDGLADTDDPLPWSVETSSWPVTPISPGEDGLPPTELSSLVAAVNFAGRDVVGPEPFLLDMGATFSDDRGFGWKRELSASVRQRQRMPEVIRDTFLFTRSHDVWEYKLPGGNYRVTVCVGDSDHEQLGQNVTVEGQTLMENQNTESGMFHEAVTTVAINDGRLTMEIGRPGSKTNTCVNWLLIERVE